MDESIQDANTIQLDRYTSAEYYTHEDGFPVVTVRQGLRSITIKPSDFSRLVGWFSSIDSNG